MVFQELFQIEINSNRKCESLDGLTKDCRGQRARNNYARELRESIQVLKYTPKKLSDGCDE